MNCINLVVPMNPCPCGYYPDMSRCRCTPYEIRRYLRRVSGPVLDRIDICVEAQPVEFEDVAGYSAGENSIRHEKRIRVESSAMIRERVLAARDRQTKRFGGTGLKFNSDMKAADMERFCSLGDKEKRFMEQMFTAMKLSARGYHRILKVARTIADLEECSEIEENHLAEAISYRQMEVFQ